MKIIITSPTKEESRPFFERADLADLRDKGIDIIHHIGGVGMLATTYSLATIISTEKPDLIIQAGIAGAFKQSITLSDVVVVKNEYIADLGVEENGAWKDIYDLNLESPDSFPFEKGGLPNHLLNKLNTLNLQEVTGITINEITTRQERIKIIEEKFAADIESMEGAAFHYVCRRFNAPFMQIRSVSNYVGERNKSAWRIKDAVFNLNETLFNYISNCY